MNPVPKPIKQPKKKKSRKKKTDTRKLIEKIDDICSIINLLVHDCTCMLCGGVANQTHHFFHKSNHGAVRFAYDNLCPLDFGCHNFTVHTKGDTEDLRDRLIERIGQDRFDSLKIKSKELADRSEEYLNKQLIKKIGTLRKVSEMYGGRAYKLSNAAFKRLQEYLKEETNNA